MATANGGVLQEAAAAMIEARALEIELESLARFSARIRRRMEKTPELLREKTGWRAALRAAYGQHGGDRTAQAVAKGWAETAADLRRRLLAAGGVAGPKEGPWPQTHDAARIRRVGPDLWIKSFDAADRDAMRRDSGLDEAELNDALSHEFAALASRGADRRFASELARFATVESFLSYQAAFGGGDLFGGVLGRVREMALGVALAETGAAGAAAAGMGRSFEQRAASLAAGGNRADDRMAMAAAELPFIGRAEEWAALPRTKMTMRLADGLAGGGAVGRAAALRTLGIAEFYLGETRRARLLSDAASGLLRVFPAPALMGADIERRGASALAALRLEVMGALAALSSAGWDELSPPLRDALLTGGMDRALWDAARRFALLQDASGAAFMDPMGMIRGGDADQARAGVVLDDLLGAGSVSPEKVEILRALAPDGLSGALLLLADMGDAMTAKSRLERLAEEGLSAVAHGALIAQMRAIAKGEPVSRIDDPEFWAKAFALGGGFAFYGDFLRLAADQTGDDLSAAAPEGGPVAAGDDYGARAMALVERDLEGTALWCVRLALDRAICARLAFKADPQLEEGLMSLMRRAEADADQLYWRGRGA